MNINSYLQKPKLQLNQERPCLPKCPEQYSMSVQRAIRSKSDKIVIGVSDEANDREIKL